MWLRFIAFPLAVASGLLAAAFLVLALLVVLAYPNLPELNALTAYQPKVPLRIYTAEGVLIGEFGEERAARVGERRPARRAAGALGGGERLALPVLALHLDLDVVDHAREVRPD